LLIFFSHLVIATMLDPRYKLQYFNEADCDSFRRILEKIIEKEAIIESNFFPKNLERRKPSSDSEIDEFSQLMEQTKRAADADEVFAEYAMSSTESDLRVKYK